MDFGFYLVLPCCCAAVLPCCRAAVLPCCEGTRKVQFLYIGGLRDGSWVLLGSAVLPCSCAAVLRRYPESSVLIYRRPQGWICAVLRCCCAAVLRCCCAAVLLCCCTAVLLCCCAAVLLCCEGTRNVQFLYIIGLIDEFGLLFFNKAISAWFCGAAVLPA